MSLRPGREFGMPNHGVEAIWRKPRRPGKVASVAGASIRAVEHRTSGTCERADPATRAFPNEGAVTRLVDATAV